MGIDRFSLREAPARVEATASGSVGYIDILLHLQEEISAGTLARPRLVDADHATLELDETELTQLEVLLAELGVAARLGPIAVVAGPELARQLTGIALRIGPVVQLRSFEDRADATAWLGAVGDTASMEPPPFS